MSGTEQRVECAKHTSAKNLLVVNSQERVVLFFTWVRAEQLLREQVLPTVSLNVLRESSDQSNTESEGPTFRSVTLGAIVLSLFTSTIISLNMLSRCLVAIQLTLCLLIQHAQHLARAGELSTTIDDGYGDTMTNLRPRYLPAGVGVWTDQTCEGCPIRPDLSQTFRETYTAATRRPGQPKVSLTISFTGHAIYVFFILANNAGPDVTTATECDFIMDFGERVHFSHAPNMSTTDLMYHQLVYSRGDLHHGPHQLEISMDGDVSSYINFDHAVYSWDDAATFPPALPSSTITTDTSSSSSSSSSSDPAPAVVTITSTMSDPNIDSISTSSSGTGQRLGGNSPNPVDAESGSFGSGDDSESSSAKSSASTKPKIGAIVGGTLGGLAGLAILIFLFLFVRRRQRELWLKRQQAMRESSSDTAVDSDWKTDGHTVNDSPTLGRFADHFDRLYGCQQPSATLPGSHYSVSSMSTAGLDYISGPYTNVVTSEPHISSRRPPVRPL